MALHPDLSIHRTGIKLLSLAYDAQRQMPRDVKRNMGSKISDHCFEMLDLMAMANAAVGDSAERAKYIRKVMTRQRALTIMLRVSYDKEWVSPKIWAQSVQLLDSIGKQSGGWLKKTTATKGPAA